MFCSGNRPAAVGVVVAAEALVSTASASRPRASRRRVGLFHEVDPAARCSGAWGSARPRPSARWRRELVVGSDLRRVLEKHRAVGRVRAVPAAASHTDKAPPRPALVQRGSRPASPSKAAVAVKDRAARPARASATRATATSSNARRSVRGRRQPNLSSKASELAGGSGARRRHERGASDRGKAAAAGADALH